MSNRNSSLPNPDELTYALSIIANILETLDVKYGFIGGAAVAAASREYGLEPRQTEDVDLIIQPTSKVSAFTISELFNTDVRFSKSIKPGSLYGVPRPRVIVMRGSEEILVGIEIFDHIVWSRRRAYYDLDLAPNFRITMTVEGRSASFLNACWLLRQKISSYLGRGNASKRDSDMRDIDTLCVILGATGQTLEVTVSEEVTALKTVYEAATVSVKDKLRRAVNCPQVFSPTTSFSTSTASASA